MKATEDIKRLEQSLNEYRQKAKAKSSELTLHIEGQQQKHKQEMIHLK